MRAPGHGKAALTLRDEARSLLPQQWNKNIHVHTKASVRFGSAGSVRFLLPSWVGSPEGIAGPREAGGEVRGNRFEDRHALLCSELHK